MLSYDALSQAVRENITVAIAPHFNIPFNCYSSEVRTVVAKTVTSVSRLDGALLAAGCGYEGPFNLLSVVMCNLIEEA